MDYLFIYFIPDLWFWYAWSPAADGGKLEFSEMEFLRETRVSLGESRRRVRYEN